MNRVRVARTAAVLAAGALLAMVAVAATVILLKPAAPPVVAPIEVAEPRAVPDRVQPPAGRSVSPAPSPAPRAPSAAPAALTLAPSFLALHRVWRHNSWLAMSRIPSRPRRPPASS